MIKIKTLVEFFDTTQIENVSAILRFKPHKVIFIGFKNTMNKRRIRAIEKFLKLRYKGKYNPQIEYISDIFSYDLDGIVDLLQNIVEENEDVYFDITGGKEITLVAAGIVSARKKVSMFLYNVTTGTVFKLRGCENLPETKTPELTIRETIVLNGGEIIRDRASKYDWDFHSGFKKDIEAMWNICKKNPWDWNEQTSSIANFAKFGKVTRDFVVTADLAYLSNKKYDAGINKYIIKDLINAKLISDFYIYDNDKISFKAKNEQIYKCLTKAGDLLELYTYVVLKEIQEENPGFIDDIDMGVWVDWDGRTEGDKSAAETMNEIDVILMCDEVPVFISCKNGAVKKDALYELNTVSQHFGNKYNKRILIAACGDFFAKDEKYLFRRADDMGIIPIGMKYLQSKESFKNKLIKILTFSKDKKP